MLFMVWEDSGSVIRAYAVPDDFTSRSNLNFFNDGELIKTVEPNAFNEFMKDRHETGQVGFVVDETVIPGLAGMTELEVREAATNILVHRRTRKPVVAEKLFRLETHLFPLWRLDQWFKPHFRLWYDRIDRYTAETARNILSFHDPNNIVAFQEPVSLYSSGRLLYKTFDYYIYTHQKTAITIQNPYQELAERLILFGRLGTDANKLLNERDAMIFGPVIEIAAKLKNFDEAEFRDILGKVEPRTLSLLANPLTRQLTSSTPDEPAVKGAVSLALKTLSEFDIVGVKSRNDLFASAIGELVGVDTADMPPLAEIPGSVAIAKQLRAVRWVEGLIEQDLELYSHVKLAFDATE